MKSKTKKIIVGYLVFVLITISYFSPAQIDFSPSLQSQLKFQNITIQQGLSNNHILCFLKDREGFVWIGTGRGLNRFDGEQFKVYLHQPSDSTGIPFNYCDYLYEDPEGSIWIRSLQQFVIYCPEKECFMAPGPTYKNTSVPIFGIRSFLTDKKGNIWFGHINGKVYCYYPQDQRIDSLSISHQSTSIESTTYVNSLTNDGNNNIWAVANNGTLYCIDPETLKITKQIHPPFPFNKSQNDFRTFADSNNGIWFYSKGQSYGLFHWTADGKLHRYSTESEEIKLNNNIVEGLIEDENGKLWVATDHGGINCINTKSKTVTYIRQIPGDPFSLPQNSITCLYKSSDGIIWAGTYKKGFCYYHKDLIKFNQIKHIPGDPTSIPFDDINCFAEDKWGNLWLGTNGNGLIYYNRRTQSYKSYRHQPNQPGSLSDNVIICLFIDPYGILWIGTYQGGLNRFDGNRFKHYVNEPNNPHSLSDNRVWTILEDSHKNFWVGTLRGGLHQFDRKTETFTRYSKLNTMGSSVIMKMIEDSEQNLWIGTGYGINKININTQEITYFEPAPGKAGRLSHENVVDLHEDTRGLIWMATGEGLNVIRKNENYFLNIDESDGLANASIRGIEEDMKGNIWVSTMNGISKIEIKSYPETLPLNELQFRIENFNVSDGLQGAEFNEKASFRTSKGELLFGGANGFNLFYPNKINRNEHHPKLILTELKIFNQTIKPGITFRNHKVLDRSITHTRHLTLKHNENAFSIRFSSLHFFNTGKELYQYKLEGFNNEWMNLSAGNKEIAFTNLDAGDYHLHIRAGRAGENNWAEMQPPLQITVLPPFWQTGFAYFLYVLLTGGILFVIWKILSERQRLKFEAEQEHREAERIQQLDALKTRFFMNISHEFRTPLSLIISPLNAMLDRARNEQQRKQLELMHRNATRLLSLVNQLLDFRKLELQKLKLEPEYNELISFVRNTAESFAHMAKEKHIDFTVDCNVQEYYSRFDKDKLEKTIYNLLSNALKFTPEKGKVKLTIQCDTQMPHSEVQISVSDTGVGIAQEFQSRIFERFYQIPDTGNSQIQGSGIGLAMVKEYVQLMNGTIELQSSPNRGSTFTLTLPLERLKPPRQSPTLSDPFLQNNTPVLEPEPNEDIAQAKDFDQNKKTIAIIDDDPELREYLNEQLRKHYNIITAADGESGWAIVIEHQPDLIISDMVMPRMDGVELCKKLKNTRKTKHIPFILLTAKTDNQPQLEAFKAGAEAYITKPFDFRILEARIKNQLQLRQELLSLLNSSNLNPEKADVKWEDEEFVRKALKLVEKRMTEPSFSVEIFGKEMGMSRVSLYKKLVAITGKTPVEFIRTIRLKRASDLLANTQLSVSEVAYQVGFNNPRYFSKYFFKEYGLRPSEYIEKHRAGRKDLPDDLKEQLKTNIG